MYIFVDESGSFVQAPDPDAWSVVVAFAVPETQLPKLEAIVHAIRSEHGAVREVKLKSLSEARYIRFLKDLSKIGGVAFATAVDLHSQNSSFVSYHQDQQAAKIVEHIDKMQYAAAREGLRELGNTVKSLPAQLYIQLVAQIDLFFRTIAHSSLYFVQHKPEALEYFRWRIDQKNTDPTAYEHAFKRMVPAIIQTMSLSQPLIQIIGADYSYFERFEFPAGERPMYLSDVYGLPSRDGINVGKIIREDFQLMDSVSVPGIQVADLLASGLRRLLRGGFERSHEVALLFGSNLLTAPKDEHVVSMISLTGSHKASPRTAQLLHTFNRTAKPVIA